MTRGVTVALVALFALCAWASWWLAWGRYVDVIGRIAGFLLAH